MTENQPSGLSFVRPLDPMKCVNIYAEILEKCFFCEIWVRLVFSAITFLLETNNCKLHSFQVH